MLFFLLKKAVVACLSLFLWDFCLKSCFFPNAILAFLLFMHHSQGSRFGWFCLCFDFC